MHARQPLQRWPTPSAAFLAWFAVGLLPAALVAVWPAAARVTYAFDASVLVLYGLDVFLWRREDWLGVDVTVPARISRGTPVTMVYTLINKTRRRLRVTWHHAMPDHFTPEAHAGHRELAPGESAEWQARVTAQRRGAHQLTTPVVAYSTPLGLATARVTSLAPAVAVLPATAALQRFDSLARLRRQHEMGVVAARQRGEGSDIVGLRPYRAGDALTRIDWKATARSGGTLVSREMQAERRQNIVLLLDCGRRMAGEVAGRSRLDHAVEAALLLAHVAQRADDRVGLVAFADRLLRVVQPVGRRSGATAVASALFNLECVLREPPYAAVAAQTAAHFRRRSLMVLFTDAAEPASLAALERPMRFLGERHLVVCVLFADTASAAALGAPLDDMSALYRTGAAAELVVERTQALGRLRRAGALIVEAAPADLTTSVINRYLDVKARHLL